MNGVLQEILESYDVLQASYGVLSSALDHASFKLRIANADAVQNTPNHYQARTRHTMDRHGASPRPRPQLGG